MRRSWIAVLVLAFAIVTIGDAGAAFPQMAGRADAGYDTLLNLFRDFRTFQKPGMSVEGVPDYSSAAMAAQKAKLPEFQRRLAAISTRSWPIPQRVDYEIVRAEMNGLEFDHRVLRPWSRDPGFYVVIQNSEPDVPAREGAEIFGCLNLWEFTFPLDQASSGEMRRRLSAIPSILRQARANLTEDARDLWRLGARRKTSEAMALDRLAERLSTTSPDLAALARQARAAVDDFRSWLEARIPKFERTVRHRQS